MFNLVALTNPLHAMHKHLFLFIVLILSGCSYLFGQNADTTSIEHVNVIPMTSELVIPDQRVIIANGKIVRIESALTPTPKGIRQTIDGTGKYLVPGFSEMHYHWRSKDNTNDFKLLIANGITTVRNMAALDGQDHARIKKELLSGNLVGPNYFTTGLYLRSNDLQSIQQVKEVVKTHKQKGFDFLKIADNLPKDIYLTLLDEAQANGLQVIGHAQRNLPLEYSLRMKSIEHVEEFLYLSDENKGKIYKLSEPELKKLALQLKSSGIYIGSTLVVFDFINNCLNDEKFAALQKHGLAMYLAKEERENFLTEKNDYRKLKTLKIDGVKAEIAFGNYFTWMKNFIRILSDNNVPLLIGSDTYGMVIIGFSLHKEFELLQESGIKPYDILLANTINSARYLNTYSVEGTITEGKNANMVLLNKNPLEDIRNTQSIEGVLLKGKWFSRAQLDQMLKEVASAYK